MCKTKLIQHLMSNYLKNVKQYIFFHLPYLPSQVVINVKSTLSQSAVFTLRRVSEWFVLLSNVRLISTTVNAQTYYNFSHNSGNTAHVYHCSPSKYNMCCHEGQSTAKSINYGPMLQQTNFQAIAR